MSKKLGKDKIIYSPIEIIKKMVWFFDCLDNYSLKPHFID